MAKADRLREAFLRVVERAEEAVDAALPSSLPPAPTDGQQITYLLWMGCRDLHQGTGMLLGQELVPEASILTRTLAIDSIRLRFFFKHADKLEEWAVRFMLDSISHEEQLERTAAALRLSFAGERVERLRAEKRHWKKQAKAMGLKTTDFPCPTAMLKEIGREEARYFVAYTSQIVHSNRLALNLRLRIDTGKADAKEKLHEILRVGYDATWALLIATKATGHLLDWPAAKAPDFGLHIAKEMDHLVADSGLPLVQVLNNPKG